jgi:hypothetical protein
VLTHILSITIDRVIAFRHTVLVAGCTGYERGNTMNIFRTIIIVLAGLFILSAPAFLVTFYIITIDPVNMMGGWGPIMFITALAFGLGIVALADRFLNRQ